MKALHRALAVVMLLSACSPRDGRFDPSHFTSTGAGAPPDIVLPAGYTGRTFGGIVTLDPTSEAFCCAATAHVDVPVRKDGPADTLRIGVFLAPTFVDQRLRVTFSDGTVRTVGFDGTGFTVAVVSVPKRLRAVRGLQRIRIEATRSPYTLASLSFE
jgi:hypothetical protein